MQTSYTREHFFQFRKKMKIFIFTLIVLGSLSCVTVECSSSSHHPHHKHKDVKPKSSEKKNDNPSIFVDTRAPIAQTDDDYVCATMDYDSWTMDLSFSNLNLDLNNKILVNAVKAFSPLKIRVGGTIQNILRYQEVGDNGPCLPFVPNATQIFRYNHGCLPLSRWDELNQFYKKTGAVVVFGLNALAGKTILPTGITVGEWDSNNAKSLMKYTVDKGYDIHGWELGNELSGKGVGATIPAGQYAGDVKILQALVQKVYEGHKTKPIVLAPGGFFDNPAWFTEFLRETTTTLQVITHHIYNVGPGEDNHLAEKIMDPSFLDRASQVYTDVQNMLKKWDVPAKAWVGEAAGAFHGGHWGVTDVFLMNYWYLDQMGRAAAHDTKTFCRQDIIGGRYGFLNSTSFLPNPDYYSALLWHRLMGKNVLATSVLGPNNLRAYSHCSKQSGGIALVLLNYDGQKNFEVSFSTENGSVNSDSPREEYHFTAPNGDLHSYAVQLNGQILAPNSEGEMPELKPERADASRPLNIAPYSVVFVHFPHLEVPACKA